MNPAQKRAWLDMIISLAGLVFCGSSYLFFSRAGSPPYSAPWMYHIPLMHIPIVLCMTGYVLTGVKFKAKNFDEREIILSRKSLVYGFLGVFSFLTFMALVGLIQNFVATIPLRTFLLLIVSAFFFSNAVTSISFLMMYQSKLERG